MCDFPDCDRADRYGGFCNTHYHQKRRTGEMWPIGSVRSLSRTKGARSVEECLHPGCGGITKAKGYCAHHYHQFHRTGQTWDGRFRPLPPLPPCSLDGCEEPQRRGKTGLCQVHAQSNARNLRDYGIGLLERQEMERQQSGCCAICTKPETLHLDHSHEDGKVRGLLCGPCNRGIGLFGDSPEVLRAAAQYLDERGW